MSILIIIVVHAIIISITAIIIILRVQAIMVEARQAGSQAGRLAGAACAGGPSLLPHMQKTAKGATDGCSTIW